MPNYNYPYYPQNYYSQMQAQTQNGGFVSVHNELEARNYPIGLGNSVTFKDETAPYIYTKTMGLSQFDTPKFEKYKLVKETPTEPQNLPQNDSFDPQPILNTIDGIKSEISSIWGEIEGIKNDHSKSEVAAKRTAKRKEDGDD